jgi:hypothetical protein
MKMVRRRGSARRDWATDRGDGSSGDQAAPAAPLDPLSRDGEGAVLLDGRPAGDSEHGNGSRVAAASCDDTLPDGAARPPGAAGVAASPERSAAPGEEPGLGYHVFNRPEEIVNIKSSQDFIREICKALDDGYGFVPFIGAGMSAPSGAPLVSELHHYLHACIAMALGVGEPGKRPWNPRTDQWPPFTIRNEYTQADWLLQIKDEHTRRLGQPWSPETLIFQQATGDLAEWRGALVFLSRIVREMRGPEGEVEYGLALDAPDAEVIDSGIRRAVSGRQPTLGHRMLATLATQLRLDIILTTNFDDLLESAFREVRNPLSVFEVHMASSLPPWSALEEKRSLVKMHGNLYSLRVDYTLDALPVESDRWRFLEYLLSPRERQRLAEGLRSGSLASGRFEHDGTAPARQARAREKFEHGNHLLVMRGPGVRGPAWPLALVALVVALGSDRVNSFFDGPSRSWEQTGVRPLQTRKASLDRRKTYQLGPWPWGPWPWGQTAWPCVALGSVALGSVALGSVALRGPGVRGPAWPWGLALGSGPGVRPS